MTAATNWREVDQQISKVVRASVRPVAVAFLEAEPATVKKYEGTQPSGCSFWRLAAEGRIFYTVPENHFNCAVGAYTHNIALSPDREKEAEQDSAWCVGPDARPLTEGMIRKYQQRADALLMQSDEKSRRKSFRRHLAQRRHLYSKSVLAGDYRSALAAARDEAELLGLYPAKGVAVAEPGSSRGDLNR